ncbi:MAG: WbqC family protein [Deltaproteobacteria bacterium]|nr:WbqC family protein [Deltaproteobacteria bacterium]MBW2136668.1 WbqC family protein [Deltaproteobacteria bacterium]
MILSVSQPYFAPYPGFFHKVSRSDTFVILDEVQFPRGTTWVTRNRFKNDKGILWMTIPVWKKGLGFQKINEVRIYDEGHHLRKYLASLKSAYGKAPFFQDHLPFLERIFSAGYERLIEFNVDIIRHILKSLGIGTKIRLLSELGIHSTGEQRLVDICMELGARCFLAQNAARKYLNEDLFQRAGIGIEFFRPPSPVYPQLWGEFVPNLSALDLLFNCGPGSRNILSGKRGT